MPWLHAMGAVPLTLHQLLRFPTEQGIEEVRGDQLQAKNCSMAAMKSTYSIREPEKAEIEDEDIEVLNDVGKEPTEKSEETLKKILVQDGDEERFFLLGSGLAEEEKKKLEAFLRANIEVFAWTAYEMPSIDLKVTCHKLNVDRSAKPIIQRARRPTLAHVEAVEKEVDRLLEARAIREVHYPTWLSNTVVVKKKNGKWRVCIDFTSLNKACPKDSFPLPKIDQLVDTTSGYGRMNFLDAYRGYHQIAMEPADEEKTAFITPKGLYCYRVMPFGLKNASATYQRLVTKMFKHLIGRTVEVYIDNMVVKTKEPEGHLTDLKAVFEILKTYRLRLNASKCAFGVGSGKFLRYLVTKKGIEASPDQIKAILELKSSTSAK
ncbi:hypothetical protein CsSME_00034767 [Camellia sinensis var. sinensis]